MNFTDSQRRLLAIMPDLSFGQDQNDYVRACVDWARDQGHNWVDVMVLAKAKWQSWEVSRLLDEIENGDQDALKRGVIKLLKDVYIV